MTISRRLAHVARHLAREAEEPFPDLALLRHALELEAEAAGVSLETLYADLKAETPEIPELAPGETLPAFLARCAATSGFTAAEIRSEIALFLEEAKDRMTISTAS